LDGHGIHTHGPNIDLCRDNMIDLCFFPSRTAHVLQPLDVGICNSYKAVLGDFNMQYLPAATKTSVLMLGRSLTTRMQSLNQKAIRHSFYC
jgi:hypothetical protein